MHAVWSYIYIYIVKRYRDRVDRTHRGEDSSTAVVTNIILVLYILLCLKGEKNETFFFLLAIRRTSYNIVYHQKNALTGRSRRRRHRLRNHRVIRHCTARAVTTCRYRVKYHVHYDVFVYRCGKIFNKAARTRLYNAMDRSSNPTIFRDTISHRCVTESGGVKQCFFPPPSKRVP